MPHAFRERCFVTDILPMLEIARAHGAIVILAVRVEIDEEVFANLKRGWAFDPIWRERRRDLREWALDVVARSELQMLFDRFQPFVFENEIEATFGVKDGGVDHLKTGIE